MRHVVFELLVLCIRFILLSNPMAIPQTVGTVLGSVISHHSFNNINKRPLLEFQSIIAFFKVAMLVLMASLDANTCCCGAK